MAAVIIVCMLLGACAPTTGAGDDTPVSSTEDTSILTLFESGATEYKIIRPDKKYDGELKAAVGKLREAVTEYTGAKIEVLEDWVKNEADILPQAKEILVGVTNRAESAAAYEGLKSGDLIIRADAASGRIVIVGGSDAATAEAVGYFIENFLKPSGGTVKMKDSYSYISRAEYDLSKLTLCGCNIDEYEIVLPDSADRDEKYAARLIAEVVNEKTGVVLPVVTEKNKSDKLWILIGRAATGGVPCAGDEFCLGRTLKDGKMSVLFGGDKGMAVVAAHAFADYFIDAEGEVSFDLPAAEAKKYTCAVYPDDPLGIAGGTRVALADQKNAACVVVDIAGGSNAPALWSFAPTQAAGFSASGYGNRIDECRLRYSDVLKTYVLGLTSSSGYIAVAEYPSGKCIFDASATGYGPHSIEYLPCGAVAVACSGNGVESKACVRFYPADEKGSISRRSRSIPLEGAHGVIWDDERELLWALGSKDIKAFAVTGEGTEASLSEVTLYAATLPGGGGHDIAVFRGDSNKMWISGKKVVLFDKSNGSFSEAPGSISAGSVKCIGNFDDGRVIRTVAANVYAAHDTDRFTIFDAQGKELSEAVFSSRAFYKARPFDPRY